MSSWTPAVARDYHKVVLTSLAGAYLSLSVLNHKMQSQSLNGERLNSIDSTRLQTFILLTLSALHFYQM